MTTIQHGGLKSDMAEGAIRIAANHRADSALIRKEGSGTVATPIRRATNLFRAAMAEAEASSVLSELAHDLRVERRHSEAEGFDSRAADARDRGIADLKGAAATVIPRGAEYIALLFGNQ